MDVRERDLDDLFHKYGRIRGIDIKRPNRYACMEGGREGGRKGREGGSGTILEG